MFRADINALRFIAVISVLLFHFKVPFFLGGYAGVDVFFVISGFLMAEILSRGPVTSVGILEFYKKRFNRIFPALSVMSIVTALAWMIILPPVAFKQTLLEFFSAISFTSNIYYMNSLSGYFSDSADSMPFLHTWSLGVEFQFYILFPLLYIAICKIKANRLFVYFVIAVVSFIACIIMSKHNSNNSFYLLPFRAWELLIGAMISSCGRIPFSDRAKKIIEVISISGIVIFIALADQPNDWPGFEAAIPCLLTAAIIMVNVDNEHILLRHRSFQYIGKWSYSIYLVHWPIVSLIYTFGMSKNVYAILAGITSSLILGWVSYQHIEQKSKSHIIRRYAYSAVLISIISISGFISLSSHWHNEKTLSFDRYSEYAKTNMAQQQFSSSPGENCFLTMSTPGIEYFDKSYCLEWRPDRPSILLIGDSHAAQFSKAIRDANPGARIIQITASGCPVIPQSRGAKYCVELMNYAFDNYLKDKKFDLIIAASDWDAFMGSNDIPKGMINANKIFKELSKNVIFIGQTKKYESSLVNILLTNNNPMPAINEVTKSSLNTRDIINKLSGKVKILDLFSYGCSNGACELYDEDFNPIYFDNNHFTYAWSVKIAKQFFKY